MSQLSTVTVGTDSAGTVLVAARSTRKGLVIHNTTGQLLYVVLGDSATVTPTTSASFIIQAYSHWRAPSAKVAHLRVAGRFIALSGDVNVTEVG